ncbi:MAG: hypothetical protein R3F20_08855 [Planctomycetota bacterium]
MTRGCPGGDALWALMDGELGGAHGRHVREHVRSCLACRSRLESASRVQGELFARPPVIEPADFEDRFRTRLLSRLATSEEHRRARGWPRVAAVAAGLLVAAAAFAWTARSRSDSGASPRSDRHEVAEADRRLREAQLRVRTEEARLALLDALQSRESTAPFSSETVGALERRFAAVGLRLENEVVRAAESAPLSYLGRAVEFMGAHGARDYTPALRRLLSSPVKDDPAVGRQAFEALARIDTGESVRMLERAARDPETSAPALAALVESGSDRAWQAVERLARRADGTLASDLVAAVAKSDGETSAAILRQLYVDGVQSERLVEALVARPSSAAWARREIERGATDGPTRRRLIALLGAAGDREAVAIVARALERPGDEEIAARTLLAIGDESGLLALAGQLELESRRHRDGAARRRHEAARDALSELGPREADLFLDRAIEATGRAGRRLVLAAGLCGDDGVLERLARLVDRDEYELEALEAIAEIGGERALALLTGFTRHGDARVRANARRHLERLSGRPGRGSFVAHLVPTGGPLA